MMKSKKLISLFVSAAMLITMLASFTTVAFADEAAPAYTMHLWETYEDGNSATISSRTSFTSIDGKYGRGAKYTYSEYNSGVKYAQIDFPLSDTITVAEALKNNLKVEVEFDFYASALASDDNYFYLTSSAKDATNYAAGFSMKASGQTKVLKYGDAGKNIDVKSKYTLSTFHTIKIVVHAEKAGYTNPVTNSATTADGWVLDGFYFDGVEQKSDAKYTLGGLTGTYDFTNLYFRFKSNEALAGEIGLDNVSVTSYPTPADGKSPVPDRHKFMDKVLTYTDKVGTTAYNSALALFEKSYVTKDDISDALYVLAGDKTMYTITDIGKDKSYVQITSTDTTGGTPILVVGAYNKACSKLYDAQCIKLTDIKNGEDKQIYYDLDNLPEDVVIKAFIFSSLDSLVPLAAPRAE